MEFWGYYRVIRRRRWLIAAAFLIAAGIAFVINRPGTLDYAATATMSAPSLQHFFFVTGAASASATGSPSFPTQEDLNARTALAMSRIRSREVATRVIQELHLSTHPEELIQRISADKDPVSNLIKVTVTGATTQDAITLANTLADTAAAYDRETQLREATLAREFVEKQAAQTHMDLQAAENSLLTFQQAYGKDLATPKGTQAATLESDLRLTNRSLQELQVKEAAILTEMKGQRVVRSDRRITDNPIAATLRTELVQLEVTLMSELAIHTERYPAVVALKAKIDAVKDRLRTELNRTVDQEEVKFNPVYDSLNQTRINLEIDKLALLARKEALQRASDDATRELPGFAQRQLALGRLTRNVEILSKQFSDLQTQVSQTRVREQEARNLGSLAVAEHARTAQPFGLGGLRFKLTLASILGLLGGVGVAFFLEYLDNSLKTPQQAERLLGVPALATIPRHNPPFHEAYRMLRISLEPHMSQEGADVLLVTSPTPKGGTSTVVANLARAFAQAGRRTIVVDADGRRPTQHAHFGVGNGKGLIEVLSGTVSLKDALVKTDVPNLWVLPSGTPAKEAGELLSAQAMNALLGDLKRAGDVILLDTPPGGAFSDVFAMAPPASGVVLVLGAGKAPRGVEQQVKVQLERVGAKVLGVVLTKVRPDLVDSYYYQRFYRTTPRRRLSTAAARAAALIVVAGLGILAGFAAKAGSRAVDQWLFPAGQHTVIERVGWVFRD